MDLEEVWSEIELQPPDGPGFVSRRIAPESDRNLFLATAFPSVRRMFILEVANSALTEELALPSTRAVQTTKVELGSDSVQLRVELLIPEARGVFTPFIANVAAAVSVATDDHEAVRIFIERFQYWRRLLSGDQHEGLGLDAAQGLWGELWVLRHFLYPIWREDVVASWTGPEGDDVDYRRGTITVEVKTLRGDRPAIARITSERQLDNSHGTTLYLVALLIDRHRQGSGESLPDMVHACLDLVEGLQRSELEDRMLEAGYSDVHRDRYADVRYSIREIRAFSVEDRFPRITESLLPDGIGGVSYLLSLDACRQWMINADQLARLLADS